MAEVSTHKIKKKTIKRQWLNLEGKPLAMGDVKKVYKEALALHHGATESDGKLVTAYDPENPLGDVALQPSSQSSICQACGLSELGADNPFLKYIGPENPLVTVITDSVSTKEDINGQMGSDGQTGLMKGLINAFAGHTGIPVDKVRFITLTRCAPRSKGKAINYRIKGNHCRNFAVQDLINHPPKLVMPVGSVALGLLCHKSNAQDWGGKLLSWRGWPDDWLTNGDFVFKRPHPADEAKTIYGHPLFGPPPPEDFRIPMFPIQAPRLIYAMRSEAALNTWKRQIIRGLSYVTDGVDMPIYNIPYYRLLTDPDQVMRELQIIIDNPGLLVCYDTETNGLHPWHGNKIVFMMFRYTTATGENVAFGFPWDYPTSELRDHLAVIAPIVIKALSVSNCVGHHLTFDMLFTFASLLREPNDHVAVDVDGNINPAWRRAQDRLNMICDAAKYDTWHMAFAYRQQKGSLGLEILAYDYVPELAGYEEDMTLLIELYSETMNPENGESAHYANCPKQYWDSHFKPYVLGDVEVCYRARDVLQAKLDNSRLYKIPIAHPTKRGMFRHFSTPNRAWIYENIMSPASRMLMKLMGRGMYIDQEELSRQELIFPKSIRAFRENLKTEDNAILEWCKIQEEETKTKAQEKKEAEKNTASEKRKKKLESDAAKGWELDLENKTQLKDILFKILRLPVQRLTKAGKKLFGETAEEWHAKQISGLMLESDMLKYAAMDKFTLNAMAVHHPQVRPLQEYRKIHKLYSTYVRPLRNHRAAGIDKKDREGVQHLCNDGCIHSQFLLTGTRTGRLSSRNPNLQQLPKDGKVKQMFVSRFGARGCLYGADLSQIELRLLAAACGDESMVKAYWEDIDLHTLTTSRIFKLRYEDFSKDHMKWLEKNNREHEAKALKLKRDIGKTTNFLTGYGGGAFGLQTSLAGKAIYLPIEECEEIIDSFFSAYPALKEQLQYYKNFIARTTVAVSIFGRVRVFPEVNSEDKELFSKALRAGCNHLIQSTASDMMLICLVVIESLMRDAGLESILVSTVHDSLLIDAIREELPQIHEIVDQVMNNIPEVLSALFGPSYDASWMIVPFAGDSEVGLNYLDMRGVPKTDIDWEKLLHRSE
jgi:DNA polymerase I-like protein with 3'-5' exonuclease and polymerase domains